jgi:RNA polymerase sigma factor (sigma-70 family)
MIIKDEAPRILISLQFKSALQSRIGRAIDADDVIQTTWFKQNDGIDRGTAAPANEIELFAWLLRAAENSAKDIHKAEHRRKNRENVKAQQHEIIDTKRPAGKIERSECRAAIFRAIRASRLSEHHRCALWASLRDNVDQCACIFGVPAVTIRVWASRARKKILPALEQTGLRDEY